MSIKPLKPCFPNLSLPATFNNALSYTQQIAILQKKINEIADNLLPASDNYGLVKAHQATSEYTDDVRIRDGYLYVKPTSDTNKENKGKMTISGVEYTVSKHTLSWIDSGTTYSYEVLTV